MHSGAKLNLKPKRYRCIRADESLADNGQYFIINAPQRKGEIKGTGKVSSGILSVRNTQNVFSKGFQTGQIS